MASFPKLVIRNTNGTVYTLQTEGDYVKMHTANLMHPNGCLEIKASGASAVTIDQASIQADAGSAAEFTRFAP